MLSHVSHVWLYATLWTIVWQVPLYIGFSRKEYWGGSPCPSPGDLPDSGFQLTSLVSPALTGGYFYHYTTWETHLVQRVNLNNTNISLYIFQSFPPNYLPIIHFLTLNNMGMKLTLICTYLKLYTLCHWNETKFTTRYTNLVS